MPNGQDAALSVCVLGDGAAILLWVWVWVSCLGLGSGIAHGSPYRGALKMEMHRMSPMLRSPQPDLDLPQRLLRVGSKAGSYARAASSLVGMSSHSQASQRVT